MYVFHESTFVRMFPISDYSNSPRNVFYPFTNSGHLYTMYTVFLNQKVNPTAKDGCQIQILHKKIHELKN